MPPMYCTREGCQVSSTGKCLEGFDPIETCPYLSRSGSAVVESEQSAEDEFVDLPLGEALTELEASAVAGEHPTKVIVLAGPAGSGKTTILTSIYEAFLDAPFANCLFAGSRTLVGFERRCHDARCESGRSEPHTSHTPVSDKVDFLHLKLAAVPINSATPLQSALFSDISGERFRELRDSAESVGRMSVLRRTDHLSIVIDGEKLVDPMQRHASTNDARALLRSIVEADVLSVKCRVSFVVSKWDLVVSSEKSDETLKFIAEAKAALDRTLAASAPIQLHEVAARPRSARLPFAHGVPTLLRYWLDDVESPVSRVYLPRAARGVREASRLASSMARAEGLGDKYDVRWV
jgi:hypothetical protein